MLYFATEITPRSNPNQHLCVTPWANHLSDRSNVDGFIRGNIASAAEHDAEIVEGLSEL